MGLSRDTRDSLFGSLGVPYNPIDTSRRIRATVRSGK